MNWRISFPSFSADEIVQPDRSFFSRSFVLQMRIFRPVSTVQPFLGTIREIFAIEAGKYTL